MPSVGIVIPVIDIDLHFLPETLAAIQCMQPAVDSVIVVHDGVADLKFDQSVRYVRLGNEPQGTGKAINYGITVTETDWIIVHGADDRPKPWFVEEIRAADQTCDILAVTWNNVTPGDSYVRTVSSRRVTPENVREGNIGIPEFSPFKRHVWQKFPIDEDPDFHMDGALMYLQAILDGAKVGYIKRPCLDFMVRKDSKWHRNAHKEQQQRDMMLRKAGLIG